MRGLSLVEPSSAPQPYVPRPPGRLSITRAADMIHGAAYDLAGKESPMLISRLIEIAAELERLARSEAAPGKPRD
jgi:hypothetical protein